MILKVGLTGGTASGKSTIARFLGELGCVVIDADQIVHELYRPGNAGYKAILARYGSEVLGEDRMIDRQKLANIAFLNPESTEGLNKLIHPLVIKREDVLIEEEEGRAPGQDRIFIIEATLLIESGGRNRCDRIVVVETRREVQLERAVRRGMSLEDAERRISRQMTPEQRREFADYVIANDGEVANLAAEVERLFENLQKDLEAKKRSLSLTGDR